MWCFPIILSIIKGKPWSRWERSRNSHLFEQFLALPPNSVHGFFCSNKVLARKNCGGFGVQSCILVCKDRILFIDSSQKAVSYVSQMGNNDLVMILFLSMRNALIAHASAFNVAVKVLIRIGTFKEQLLLGSILPTRMFAAWWWWW